MRKTVLIVLGSLKAGGAERSCVTFLKTLPKGRYDIDLMLLSPSGIFLKSLPEWINIVAAPSSLSCLCYKPIQDWQFYLKSPRIWFKKIIRTWRAKRQSELHVCQSVWKQWETDVPILKKKYDVAIGGLEGFYNYFIIKKVCASRKILWIHNDYDKLKYNPYFDIEYFSKADIIATISPISQQKLQRFFPSLGTRICFVENITNAEYLNNMSKKPIEEEFFANFDGLKIVSCGQLIAVKAYERAIMAAALIKKEKIPFKWIIVGNGSQRKNLLQLKKETGLDEEFHFIGLRDNPYPYMRYADMLVVTSQYEGRPMVIDEALTLDTPVVTTNYPTATDAVEHEKTGLICEMTPRSIADAIIRLYRNKGLYMQIKQNLTARKHGNTDEIEKYIKIIDG